jgi:hypothetical protein
LQRLSRREFSFVKSGDLREEGTEGREICFGRVIGFDGVFA